MGNPSSGIADDRVSPVTAGRNSEQFWAEGHFHAGHLLRAGNRIVVIRCHELVQHLSAHTRTPSGIADPAAEARRTMNLIREAAPWIAAVAIIGFGVLVGIYASSG